MGKTTEVVIKFLKEEKNCTLVTNEISINDVFAIAEREGVEIVNLEGKKIKESTKIGLVHHIRYE